MPSFDVVSEVDSHELTNAVDQTNREISTRYDFKGSGAEVTQSDEMLTLTAQSEFQLNQMLDILRLKLSKRGIDVACLEPGKINEANQRATQEIKIRQGIDQAMAKQLVRITKDAKLKVQASVQGDQVRVTGKKRDDLQAAISLFREADLGLPLQYVNFRD
ncbi:MAG: YajQ family cyclic di-GMP-binding protein [Gammaproteobacteria bacterium]|jgi:uncharacterized protein YajQ (UPF0234 family)